MLKREDNYTSKYHKIKNQNQSWNSGFLFKFEEELL